MASKSLLESKLSSLQDQLLIKLEESQKYHRLMEYTIFLSPTLQSHTEDAIELKLLHIAAKMKEISKNISEILIELEQFK